MLNALSLPRPASNTTTSPSLSPNSPPRFWLPGAAATMLALTLCCAGCAHTPPLASVNQGPLGNAVLSTLPAGTTLCLPKVNEASHLRQLFVHEVNSVRSDATRVVLTTPLKICTPAYLAERDLHELELLRQLERLRLCPTSP